MENDRDRFDDEFDDEFFDDMEGEAEAAMNDAKKPSTIEMIGAVLFGVALIGGIGYMGYRKFFSGKKNTEDGDAGTDAEE